MWGSRNPPFIHHQQEGEQLMNDITIFNHLGNNIRVVTDEQGEPLFVLKDVCVTHSVLETHLW